MGGIQIVRRVSVAEELKRIYDIPLEARVDKSSAAKNLLEARKKQIPLLDRAINGDTKIYAEMQAIQRTYGGSAAYYPHFILDDDRTVIEDLSRIVGYSNDSLSSVAANPVGVGVPAALLLSMVRPKGMSRRDFLSRPIMAGIGLVLGGGLGSGMSHAKSSKYSSATNDALYGHLQ